MSKPAVTMAAVLGLTACGPSFIVLEIDSGLEIPTEADSLHLVTLEEANLDNELSNVDLALEEGQAFPLEILLEPSGDTPSPLRQRITARLSGTAVAGAVVTHAWESHHTTRAKIMLDN